MAPVMVGRAARVIDRIDFLTEGEFLTTGSRGQRTPGLTGDVEAGGPHSEENGARFATFQSIQRVSGLCGSCDLRRA